MISLLVAAAGRILSTALDGSAWTAKAFFLLEAMGRSLLLGLAVGVGMKVLGIRNVVAQKAAWVLVLVSALLMPGILPLSAGLHWLPRRAMVVIPAEGLKEATMPSRMGAPEPWRPAESSSTQSLVLSETRKETLPLSTQTPRIKPALMLKAVPSRGASASLSAAGWHFGVPAETKVSGWVLAGIGYCLVSLLLLFRLVWGIDAALELWMGAESAQIASELLPGRHVHIRWSAAVTSPVTVGSGIVLPAEFESWDTEKLRIVLAHEQSHVQQGDFYLQALAGLYTALFWVSPLGWWLKRRLSDLGEAISDRAGLSRADSNTAYARILLQFAAMPHRTEIGVAMARKGVLTQRIERLLNEHSFRQAFAGSRTRLLAAVLLVPAALFGATALIRVEAKSDEPMGSPALNMQEGQADPESVPDATPEAAPEAASSPAPVAGQEPREPSAPSLPVGQNPAPASAPAPPAPQVHVFPAPAAAPEPPEPMASTLSGPDGSFPFRDNPRVQLELKSTSRTREWRRYAAAGKGYQYSYTSDGDSYALVTGRDGGKDAVHFSGEWMGGRKRELDKARQMAHGDFLWFNRDGKSYVVDDPAVVAQIQAMYKPMEELGRQQEELGKQQEALGRQQEELGRRQSEARVPTPDLTKEMAILNEEMKKLQALKGGTVTQEQLADLQGKLGDLQGRLGELQGRVAGRQGELGEQQGKLGEKQGELGEQQGRLGEEQGRLAREADRKVKSIMDQSLKDGKAKPVQ